MVDPPHTALAGSDPQSSLAIGKQRIDRTTGHFMGDELTAGSAKTSQAARVQARPNVAGTVLRERIHRRRARGSRNQLGGWKGSPAISGSVPVADSIRGAGPNVAAGVLEDSQYHRTGQSVANGIDSFGWFPLQFAGVCGGRIACHPGAAGRPPGALTILQEGLAYAPDTTPGTRHPKRDRNEAATTEFIECPLSRDRVKSPPEALHKAKHLGRFQTIGSGKEFKRPRRDSHRPTRSHCQPEIVPDIQFDGPDVLDRKCIGRRIGQDLRRRGVRTESGQPCAPANPDLASLALV